MNHARALGSIGKRFLRGRDTRIDDGNTDICTVKRVGRMTAVARWLPTHHACSGCGLYMTEHLNFPVRRNVVDQAAQRKTFDSRQRHIYDKCFRGISVSVRSFDAVRNDCLTLLEQRPEGRIAFVFRLNDNVNTLGSVALQHFSEVRRNIVTAIEISFRKTLFRSVLGRFRSFYSDLLEQGIELSIDLYLFLIRSCRAATDKP